MTDSELLGRAKEIIDWFPREACPDCDKDGHDNPNCRIHAWLAAYAAYKPSVENERLRRALEGLYWKSRIEMTVRDVDEYIDAALEIAK